MNCLRKQGSTLEGERRTSISNAHKTDDRRVAKVVRGGEWSIEWER